MNSLVLAAVLSLSSLGAEAAEIAKYDLLFLAGQVGEYEDGKLVAGGIKAEAEQIMLNIKAALARRGLGLQHVVKCTVLLADIAEWGSKGRQRSGQFPIWKRGCLWVSNSCCLRFPWHRLR